jgi:hypothetical protein
VPELKEEASFRLGRANHTGFVESSTGSFGRADDSRNADVRDRQRVPWSCHGRVRRERVAAGT